MFKQLRVLWHYRGFVQSAVINEFKIRYARSRLGLLWLIVQPLSQVVIYAVILSKVLSSKLPGVTTHYGYVLYLMSGMLAWHLFSEIVTRCSTVFIEQANLIKKMNFPRITLPMIVLGSSLVNHLMLMVASLFIFVCLGHFPGLEIVWLPVLIFALAAFSLGIGWILGMMSVFIRDLTQVTPILMQLIFWATPIVYPLEIIPERLQMLLLYNPLYPFIRAYQQLFLQHMAPNAQQLFFCILFPMVLLGFSYFVFRRASPEMADVL